MKKNIKAVIFDVGGVILDWETPLKFFQQNIGISFNQWNEIFSKYHHAAYIGKMSADDYLKVGLKDLGLSKHWKKARQVVPGKFTKIRETFKLIEELVGEYKLGILTNAFKDINKEWDQKHPHRHHFTAVVDSSEVGLTKPDEKIYQLICDQLKVSASESLFIDDYLENVEAAEKMGMKTVHFTEPKKGIKKVKKILGLT